ncbi:MAG: response regulator [Candidatus Omnitrophota bacterium]|nr:response regulator [Candidatus Omnitrophota bacterium]
MAHIIVIDDNTDIREILGTFLTESGYEVTLAADGKQGVDRFREKAADLVITDLLMPEQEGVETIRILRKEAPNLRIIAMSGGAKLIPVDYLDLARKLGANRVFQKPFDIQELLKAIEDLLAK